MIELGEAMIERVQDDLGILPRKLIGDTGYGSAEMLACVTDSAAAPPAGATVRSFLKRTFSTAFGQKQAMEQGRSAKRQFRPLKASAKQPES